MSVSIYLLLRSTKENAYFSSPAGSVLSAMTPDFRVGHHLEPTGPFCLDLMASVFLAPGLVSDETLASLCLLQVCLSFF